MMTYNFEIEKIIIESSILLVSIFSTVGLLMGGLTQQFKYAYYYLGYMLYYSFPFILACFWATVSYVTSFQTGERTYGRLARNLAISFYISGFIMILLLASVVAQTKVLPENFLFFPEYQGLIVTEIVMASFMLVALTGPTVEIDPKKHHILSKILTTLVQKSKDKQSITSSRWLLSLSY